MLYTPEQRLSSCCKNTGGCVPATARASAKSGPLWTSGFAHISPSFCKIFQQQRRKPGRTALHGPAVGPLDAPSIGLDLLQTWSTQKARTQSRHCCPSISSNRVNGQKTDRSSDQGIRCCIIVYEVQPDLIQKGPPSTSLQQAEAPPLQSGSYRCSRYPNGSCLRPAVYGHSHGHLAWNRALEKTATNEQLQPYEGERCVYPQTGDA